MKTLPECIPCYLKAVISALRCAGVDEDKINETLYNVLDLIPKLDTRTSPGENTAIIFQKACELLGNRDPYYEEKKKLNEFALSQYKNLEKIVDSSRDRLMTAFKISVSGNIMDMGISPDFDIDLALREITGKDFDHSDYGKFLELLERAKLVLIIGDNSGEIVFDKILVTELMKRGIEVVYSVRQGPVLNDATIEDAEQAGMTGLCRVIEGVSQFLAVNEESCSPEFLTVFRKADIVIAKGQANFESMDNGSLAGDKTFYVLRAKCPAVARNLGVELGNIVLKKHG